MKVTDPALIDILSKQDKMGKQILLKRLAEYINSRAKFQVFNKKYRPPAIYSNSSPFGIASGHEK